MISKSYGWKYPIFDNFSIFVGPIRQGQTELLQNFKFLYMLFLAVELKNNHIKNIQSWAESQKRDLLTIAPRRKYVNR